MVCAAVAQWCPPEGMASLVCDREMKRKDSKDKLTRTWRFDADWTNGAWLQLGYAGTAAVRARRPGA